MTIGNCPRCNRALTGGAALCTSCQSTDDEIGANLAALRAEIESYADGLNPVRPALRMIEHILILLRRLP